MLRLLCSLLLVVLALPASAAVVRDLYMAQVPVNGQSPAELKRAAREGLAEVLVRVSGRADAARHTALGSALGQAESYLDQYRYDTITPEPTIADTGAQADFESAPEPAAAQPMVVLRFSRSQVDGLLRQAGLPVWGANRPNLLVWLVQDDGPSRTLVNEESQPALVRSLREEARRRGLLLSFPLLDLDDLAVVTTDLVWQMDLLALQEASRRYSADGLLVGRAAALPDGRWLGGWRLVAGEQRVSLDGEGESLDAFLTPSFNRIADALATQYVSVDEGVAPGAVQVQLAEVASYADYNHILDYFGRLSQVKSVMPVQVAAGELTLQLEISGGVAQLRRILALENRLQPLAADPLAPAVAGVPLRYRWVSRS